MHTYAIAMILRIDATTPEEADDIAGTEPEGDLCDTCMRSGVEIARTDLTGRTVCVDCDEEEAETSEYEDILSQLAALPYRIASAP